MSIHIRYGGISEIDTDNQNLEFSFKEESFIINSLSKLFVCLHGEYNSSSALWKHHVNSILQSFRFVSSDLHLC